MEKSYIGKLVQNMFGKEVGVIIEEEICSDGETVCHIVVPGAAGDAYTTTVAKRLIDTNYCTWNLVENLPEEEEEYFDGENELNAGEMPWDYGKHFE